VVRESLGKGQGDVMERLIMKGQGEVMGRLIMKGQGEGKQLHKKDQE
jgi:hypothetical protein